MIRTADSRMNRNRSINFSSAQSDKFVKQYRLEQQLSNQKAALDFIEKLLGIRIPEQDVHPVLKDGIILCQLLNKISPGVIKQISTAQTPFQQRTNIFSFLSAASSLGLENADLFETVDLYDGKNMERVVLTVLAVARKLCNTSLPSRSSSGRSQDKSKKTSPLSSEKIFPTDSQNSSFEQPSPTQSTPDSSAEKVSNQVPWSKKSKKLESVPPISSNGKANELKTRDSAPLISNKNNLNHTKDHSLTPPISNKEKLKEPKNRSSMPPISNNDKTKVFPISKKGNGLKSTDPLSDIKAKKNEKSKANRNRFSMLPLNKHADNFLENKVLKEETRLSLHTNLTGPSISVVSPTTKSPPIKSPSKSSTSPDKLGSDKIRNLRLFFDPASKQSTPSKPSNIDNLSLNTAFGKESERAISSPNLLAPQPLNPEQDSSPVISVNDSLDSINFSHDNSIVSEDQCISPTMLDGSFFKGDSGLYLGESSSEYSPSSEQAPTAEDRVRKPQNYRVGKGGLIEDLDLSIKKTILGNSRGDVLRLGNIDWDLEDDEDEDDEFVSRSSSMYSRVSTIKGIGFGNNGQSMDPMPNERLATNNSLKPGGLFNPETQSRRMMQNQVGLKKQHSRNYSEKPTSAPINSLPLSRPRSGSDGDGASRKDRISLFFESKVVAQYQLGDCIGKGQFGSVYKALNLQTGQVSAVKRIELDARTEAETESLMDEVDLLKSLTHTRIVNYEGYIKSDLYLNIILEFIENGSLLQLLRSYGTFSPTLVASYTSQILEGLIYLHDKEVVHRDLKAANILTTKDGQVKLSDFGVSLNLKVKTSDQGDVVAGTPNWMAPEVISLQRATTASDIWSLGCTIVELLTGKPPYSELNTMAALFRIVEDDCPPLPSNISKKLEYFLRSCFRKEPSTRPTAEYLLYHEWIMDTQLSKEFNSKLILDDRNRLIEDQRRDSLITDSLWEAYNSFSDDALITPPASTTTMRLPESQHHLSQNHQFVRSTFEKAILCKVCKKQARKCMVCDDCGLICHIHCALSAGPLCHTRSEPTLVTLPSADNGSGQRLDYGGLHAPPNPRNGRGFVSDGAISPRPRSSTAPPDSPHSLNSPFSKPRSGPKKKRKNEECRIS